MKRSNAMARIFSVLCSLLLVLPLTACSSEAKQLSINQPPKTLLSAESSTASVKPSAPQSSAPPETSSGTMSVPNQAQPRVQTPPSAQSTPPIQTPTSNAPETQPKDDESVKNIQITVGNKAFTATLAENTAVQSFVELMKAAPIVISMSDYSGFEKVGSLGTDLPTSNSNTTTHSGDIVLYNGNQIVIFYGSNTWGYTRLGKIDDLSGWEEALGSGDVTVTFSIE